MFHFNALNILLDAIEALPDNLPFLVAQADIMAQNLAARVQNLDETLIEDNFKNVKVRQFPTCMLI